MTLLSPHTSPTYTNDKKRYYTVLQIQIDQLKTLLVPRDNVIFCHAACPFPGFRAKGVILNLCYATSRESYTDRLKTMNGTKQDCNKFSAVF